MASASRFLAAHLGCKKFNLKVSLQVPGRIIEELVTGFLNCRYSIKSKRSESLAQFAPTSKQPPFRERPNSKRIDPAVRRASSCIFVHKTQNVAFADRTADRFRYWRCGAISSARKQWRIFELALFWLRQCCLNFCPNLYRRFRQLGVACNFDK